MKRIILAVSACILLAGLSWAGWFWWKNLRGVGPAVRPASGDIANTIDATVPEAQNNTDFPLELPDGFALSVFAKDLKNARDLERDPKGTLLVSDPGFDAVFALPDANADGKADERIVVAENLNHPHGLAFRCAENCLLYIAEENQVGMWEYDQTTFRASNKKKILDLPSGGGHATRSLLFHPDGRLLVSVGSYCNVCVEKDSRRASVLSVNPDGTDQKIFASGLRNAVFLTLHPDGKTIVATEMGRDLIGDDIPPDELNVLEEGNFYGWPYYYGNNIRDETVSLNPSFRIRTPTPSTIDFPAHSAPLGLDFINGDGWPEDLQDDFLVAFHGSWNRSVPTGYKIVKFDNPLTQPVSSDFLSGWLQNGNALGRPVDILIDPDGEFFVSDDKAGVVYRVTLITKNAAQPADDIALPEKFSLDVPFTPQAPHADWALPYKEACEEASALTVHFFYERKTFTPEIADSEILKMVEFEKTSLGFYEDTTAAQTAEVMKNYWNYSRVDVIENPSVKLIKSHIAAGRPVIVPAAGRELGNPYFTPPGPVYHMLVIRGYDKTHFFTNDVGTRRGENYRYNIDVVMNAMHDWNNGDVANGAKRIIVAYPKG